MIHVNHDIMDPFSFSSGAQQIDDLSPTLFSVYINDLTIGVKEMNCGIDIDGIHLQIQL